MHNLDWINEAALQFIDAHDEDPFFLYYAVTTPHAPHQGCRSDPRATPVGILAERPGGLPARESIDLRLQENGYTPAQGDMLWLDDCIGSILDRLGSHGIADQTIIVYLSDHGVESGKTTCYQGGMRTFGFVCGPEKWIQGGRIETSRLRLVDLAPTIFAFAGGVAADDRYDGLDLQAALKDGLPVPERVIFGEIGHSRAVIEGKWKYLALRYSDYHRNLPLAERLAWLEAANAYQRSNRWTTFEQNDPEGPFGHSGFIPDLWDHERAAMEANPNFFAAHQLYNLETDPNERNNLAADPAHASILAEMKAELRAQLAPLPGPFAEFKPATEAEPPKAERIRIGRKLMEDVFQ